MAAAGCLVTLNMPWTPVTGKNVSGPVQGTNRVDLCL
jgi:hypothetical protein